MYEEVSDKRQSRTILEPIIEKRREYCMLTCQSGSRGLQSQKVKLAFFIEVTTRNEA